MRSEPETLEQQIDRLNADSTGAFNRGDAKACAEFYGIEATLLLADRPPIKGREAIGALLGEFTAAGAKLISVDPVETRSSGDLGYCAGTYQLATPAKDGSIAKEYGKFVTVFERQAGGSWKAVIESLIGNTTAGSR
jgi:ketosteroid isomerase-like protein